MDHVEGKIQSLATSFAEAIRDETEEPYLLEALVKMAIRDFGWALQHALPDHKGEIAEQFDIMAGLLAEDDRKAEDDGGPSRP